MKKFISRLSSRTVRNVFLVIIGTVILAFGTSVFMIPFDLVSGGVTGVAIALNGILRSDIITVELMITVLTWVLFFIGLIFLGRQFAAKTLVSSIVYPLAVSLFAPITSDSFLSGYFNLANSPHGEMGLFLAAIVGGALVGLGCALTFLGGGSTGGLDVLAFIICKYIPRLRSSAVIFATDALVVLFGVFAINDIVVSILGVLSAFVVAVVIDRIFLGGERGLLAEIVTSESEALTAKIIEKLDRTTTIVEATGGYSKQRRDLVKVYLKVSEYTALLDIVKDTDKRAFVTVSKAYEIRGEGWIS